ncbi:MAG: extracellular substrate binding-like orphan protein GrrP [Spirulina sp.]
MLAGIKPAIAGTVLENIARSGQFTVGTSFDIVPYSYYNEKNEHVGSSIDIVNLIRDALEKELGRPIELQFIEINSVAEAFPMLMSGEIDMTCNTVFTFARDEYVDFTVRYSVSGIRLLTSKENVGSSFADKRIGIPRAAFVENVMKLEHPQATLVPMDSFTDATEALTSGRVDAIAGDAVIFDGLRQQLEPDRYALVPEISEPPYARHGVGCMVPENNSSFLNIANKTIITMMEGYLVGDRKYTDLIGKWFGPDGVIEVQDTNVIRTFFEAIVMNHEQIPF